MTEDDLTGNPSAFTGDRTAAALAPPQRRRRRRRRLFRREKRYSRRIRWLRLLALLVPTCFLALISMVFGMVLAVEPQIGRWSRASRPITPRAPTRSCSARRPISSRSQR